MPGEAPFGGKLRGSVLKFLNSLLHTLSSSLPCLRPTSNLFCVQRKKKIPDWDTNASVGRRRTQTVNAYQISRAWAPAQFGGRPRGGKEGGRQLLVL